MPTIAVFAYIISSLILLISFSFIILPNLGNQGLEAINSTKKTAKISTFLAVLAIFISLLTTIFLPQNHKFWLTIALLIAPGVLAFFARKKIANFLQENCQEYEFFSGFLASFAALIICISTFLFSNSLHITDDQKIILEHRVAIAVAELLLGFSVFGFAAIYLTKNTQKISALKSLKFLLKLQSKFEDSVSVENQGQDIGRLGRIAYPKILLSIILLLAASFFGFCCFGSKFLFFFSLLCTALISIWFFNPRFKENSVANKYLLQFLTAYGLSALGFVLHNPTMIIVGSCLGSLLFCSFKVYTKLPSTAR